MDEIGSSVVSLGFCPQTRAVLGQFQADGAKMPFDAGIFTRGDLLAALASERQSIARRSGSHVSASPADDGMAEDSWSRFAKTLRSEERKKLVLSNSDSRLKGFTIGGSDFAGKFGLGRETFEELTAALDRFGAQNYKLTFLSRSLGELEETADLPPCRLDHRFVGVLSRQANLRIAGSLLTSLSGPTLTDACGRYDHSRKMVKALNADVAIIYAVSAGAEQPYGSLARLSGGFAAFFEGRDRCLTAVCAEHGLYFSNGERWKRDFDNKAPRRAIDFGEHDNEMR